MDMSSVFNNTTEVADNTKQTLENVRERINNFQPTFADKLILWVDEYCVDFIYQYRGIRCDGILSNEYQVDYQFVCKMPLEIKLYFKGLIDDIRDQIEKSFIALYDYYDFCEEGDEDRLDSSKLPASVKDFIKITNVSYDFITELVALACGEDTYKFVISDNYIYKGRPYSDLIVTANTIKVNKIMINAAENAQNALEELMEETGDKKEHEKLKKIKWYNICGFEGNEKARRVYNRIIEG